MRGPTSRRCTFRVICGMANVRGRTSLWVGGETRETLMVAAASSGTVNRIARRKAAHAGAIGHEPRSRGPGRHHCRGRDHDGDCAGGSIRLRHPYAPRAHVEQPPALLADGGRPGDVPLTVPPEVQGPVIGVRNAAQLPANVVACDVPELGDDVKAEGVRVTPEVVLLDVVTDPPGVGTQRLVCITWRQGSAWSTVTTVSLDERGGTIPFGYFCCSEGGRGVAGAVVQAPEGTRWVLQERPGWWLAYPVGEHLAVPVLWSFQQSRFGAVSTPVSHVLYLDDEGEVLDEAFLRV